MAGRGARDPRLFNNGSGGRIMSDEDIENVIGETPPERSMRDEAQRAMDDETSIVDPAFLKMIMEESDKKKKKKKKPKTKASKKAGGGEVYRGRSYAYGGRVAKYKG